MSAQVVKRFLVFVVLGPFVGGSILSALYGPANSLGVLVAFPFGVLLASIIAVADHLLERDRWRLGYIAVLGYFLAALLFYSWGAGFAGCAASVFCSWLTNQSWRPA